IGNDDLADLLELDELIAPAVCLIAPSQLDQPSPLLLEALSKRARDRRHCLYLIDDSSHFDISSNLSSNVLLRLISGCVLPPNMVLIYGLIKNTVCPDLELSFLVNHPRWWVPGLEIGAELTYSRISYLSEAYYNWLFDDLLAFPFQEQVAAYAPTEEAPANFTREFAVVARDPVFATKPVPVETQGLIRLDYGELEAAVPDLLIKGAIKGLLEVPVQGLPEMVRDRVRSYLNKTRGVERSPERIVLAQGAFPLL